MKATLYLLGRIKCALGFHGLRGIVDIRGHYLSITGPRTVVELHCRKCDRSQVATVRGYVYEQRPRKTHGRR